VPVNLGCLVNGEPGAMDWECSVDCTSNGRDSPERRATSMTHALPAEGSDARRHARMRLFGSARESRRLGREYWQWLDHDADQSALDAVSQREVDAIIAYVFGVE
jgi:hypothetical protein